jgi:hypothetical protein
MARSRNIKPAFFNNDLLGDISPIGRLLFIGMWTIADCEGRIEWRPRRIKAQLLPYDDFDIVEIAISLDNSGFIRFYSVHDVQYIEIVNFLKHQNPHKNERSKGSSIPPFKKGIAGRTENKGLEKESRLIPISTDTITSDPADSLIPITDSPILIPETLSKDLSPPAPVVKKSKAKFCPIKFAESQINSCQLNLQSWGEFCDYRKTDKTKVTKKSAIILLNVLSEFSIDEQKQMIDLSIMNNWQGLFPLKNKANNHAASNRTNNDQGGSNIMQRTTTASIWDD